jgi:hypothetical protein
MKIFPHYPALRYHTWKDIGGPIGLILDSAFFVFVLMSAFLMLIFCSALLGLNYLLAPILALVSRIQTWHAA